MGCVKTHSGKRNHGGETGRLPPTIEISSSWGTSRWLPVKWNGPSRCELLHYRNPCAPEEHHPLYGKSAPFLYRSKGINKEWHLSWRWGCPTQPYLQHWSLWVFESFSFKWRNYAFVDAVWLEIILVYQKTTKPCDFDSVYLDSQP